MRHKLSELHHAHIWKASRYAICVSAMLGLALTIAVGCPGPADPGPADSGPDDPHPAGTHSTPASTGGDAEATQPTASPTPIGTQEPDQSPQRKELFADWPEPQAVLVFSGRQHGYIEPCGCAGLTNQKGGLARRQTFLNSLGEKWNVVALDVGNQVRRFGKQPEIKFHTTINGMKTMRYGAIGFGPDDLRLSAGELYLAAVGSDGTPAPFVSANVDVLGETPKSRVLEIGGRKIGVTSVLGESFTKDIHNEDVTITNAVEGIPAALEELKQAGCDYLVLLTFADLEESQGLARKFPDFDVVATSGGGDEPTLQAEIVSQTKKTRLVQVGKKGMYVAAVGLFDDAETPLRYERVPLDARFTDSESVLKLLANYQQQLEALDLGGLEVRAVPHPSGRSFVGSETCAECHTTAYNIWQETPHSHATDSLVHPGERSDIPRHFDPECLSCHVTGWDPQGFFPYRSGYIALEKSKLMHNVGCESCHGPGSDHVAAENGDVDATDDQLTMLRQQMVLTLKDAERKCMECHDLDNSPDFHAKGAFWKYWSRVKHKGKD